MSHGGSNALMKETMLEPYRSQETLSHIQWTEEGLFVICHGLSSSTFFIFDSIEAAPFKASFDGHIGSFTEYLIFDDMDCIWLDGNRLFSTKELSGLPDYPISYIFKISRTKLLIIPEVDSTEWHVLDLQTNSYDRIRVPGKSPITCAFAKYYREDYCRLLFIDQEGWQWLVTFYETGSKYAFLRCSQGLHASPIKDVFFGTCVIMILRDQFVAIHDIENFKLLLWQPVQTHHKKCSSEGPNEIFIKRILCVLESDGILMLQWGGQVQVWNFGKNLLYLNPPTESNKEGTKMGKKAEVQGILRYEYSEWQQEQRELAAMNVLRDKFNPEGMNEEEMLAMALSLSISTDPLDAGLPPSTDDEELRAVLERSRFEI